MPEHGTRGLAEEPVEPRFLVIGRVVKPHGVRGEIRVEIHTEDPDRFNLLDSVYIGLDEPEEIGIESVRYHKSWVLLKLQGYDDRDAASRLRSQWLQIPESLGLPLDDGQFYLYQILDLEVWTDDQRYLGRVTEIMETKANDVLIVQGPYGEILLPDTEEVLIDINIEEGRITVDLLPGLFDQSKLSTDDR
jgi:16S rRNA processing protein RimM